MHIFLAKLVRPFTNERMLICHVEKAVIANAGNHVSCNHCNGLFLFYLYGYVPQQIHAVF